MELHAPKEFNGAELVGVFDSGSEEWHDARTMGIGGSEVGTIMGLNPWESAYALWAKKTGQIEQPKLDSWAVRFGQKFEQPILEMFAEEHPEYEIFRTGTYRSVAFPIMLANPDALARHRETGEWAIIEVKTARYEWAETPRHYEAQTMHYMDVMGIKKAFLVAVAGWNYVERTVEWNEFDASLQRQMIHEFWDSCETMRKPAWDGAESTYETIRKLNPLISDEEVEIDGGHNLLLAQEKANEAYKELNHAKSAVMDLMGTARYAYIWAEGKKVRIASRQMRAGLPSLIISKGK